VLLGEEARALLDSITTDTLVGVRDRALIALLVYTFARVLECPRFTSTDLDGLTCKTPLVAGARGVAAQRITSVAWKRRVGGIVRPRASAVLRLMTSSKRIGRSMGSSAGFAPLRIRST
jgi:hypothetical protein